MIFCLMGPAEFESATSSLSGTRSNQLSYEPAYQRVFTRAGDCIAARASVKRRGRRSLFHSARVAWPGNPSLPGQQPFCENPVRSDAGIFLAWGHPFMHTDSTKPPAAAGDRQWEVPYARNPHFVGRDHYLSGLRKQFVADPAVGKHQALCGLGGIGKSQLALEYAYR